MTAGSPAAQFMVILDATVVNVALPSIARSLSLTPGGLQWVVTVYVLASGGLVLLGGRAADVAGRRSSQTRTGARAGAPGCAGPAWASA
jgi:MFS family permease